jgi:hypothetical protein
MRRRKTKTRRDTGKKKGAKETRETKEEKQTGSKNP